MASGFGSDAESIRNWNFRPRPHLYTLDANSGLGVYSGRYRDIPWRPKRRILPAAVQVVIKRSDMDDVLLGIVLQRLKESPLEEQTTDLLLAAFESEESLSAQPGGHAAARPSGDRAVAAQPELAGAYLRSLTVSGSRGIGKPATVSLQSGPGLTVVGGRNGSGKSSFAEALEVLLTGELRRGRSCPWPGAFRQRGRERYRTLRKLHRDGARASGKRGHSHVSYLPPHVSPANRRADPDVFLDGLMHRECGTFWDL
jgi:AAA domain